MHRGSCAGRRLRASPRALWSLLMPRAVLQGPTPCPCPLTVPGATRPGWGVASSIALPCVRGCPWPPGTVFLRFPQAHRERGCTEALFSVNYSLRLLENSRISDLEAFKFSDVLSSLMKPPTTLLRPAKLRITFVQCL